MNFSLFFVLFIFIRATLSAVAVFPTKIGETLVLDLGADVKEWKRSRDGVEETIKYCENDGPACNKWIDDSSKVVGDGREKMFANGTLVIESFKASDAGDYFTNDELERVHHTADGHFWKLARTKISVVPV